jgi:hypothetical protein
MCAGCMRCAVQARLLMVQRGAAARRCHTWPCTIIGLRLHGGLQLLRGAYWCLSCVLSCSRSYLQHTFSQVCVVASLAAPGSLLASI